MSVPDVPGARPRQLRDGRNGHDGRSSERATLAEIGAESADVLVIGGGITGAGVARDAAMRGLRTVLVEQSDLGSGTSSRSSRLIHGGLRYIETGDLSLVLEANRERRILLQIAPHLVWPLAFIFPLHRGDRIALWQLAAGMWLYDALALFRNVRLHRMLGKRALLEAEPMLRERGLLGGARFYDAQCDDARLVLATARSAIHHGALVANYTAVRSLERTAGRVVGAEIEDLITGERALVRAGVVVNATGPWADRLRWLEDPAAEPILQPTKGVHIVVDRSRIDHREAIIFTSPIDGRVLFILPWGPLSYIGTTDTDSRDPPDQATATNDDIVYLLRSANSRFPNARLAMEDVRASWAGLRPLLAERGKESSRSREHIVVQGPGGMITVAGGKLTTYRSMAREVVDRAVRELRFRDGRPRKAEAHTEEEPLPGGEAADLATFSERGLEIGMPADTVEHLLRHYGTESAGICNMCARDRGLLRRLAPTHPAIEAEVIHAVRRELAQRVEDVMVRRVHLYYEHRGRGVEAAGRVAELMGGELGWDETRVRSEAARYVEFAARGT
ncbi:MAG: glycerol-3-phosphate dehydrogenase/oxidase [Gemmatimonadales bacterium]